MSAKLETYVARLRFELRKLGIVDDRISCTVSFAMGRAVAIDWSRSAPKTE